MHNHYLRNEVAGDDCDFKRRIETARRPVFPGWHNVVAFFAIPLTSHGSPQAPAPKWGLDYETLCEWNDLSPPVLSYFWYSNVPQTTFPKVICRIKVFEFNALILASFSACEPKGLWPHPTSDAATQSKISRGVLYPFLSRVIRFVDKQGMTKLLSYSLWNLTHASLPAFLGRWLIRVVLCRWPPICFCRENSWINWTFHSTWFKTRYQWGGDAVTESSKRLFYYVIVTLLSKAWRCVSGEVYLQRGSGASGEWSRCDRYFSQILYRCRRRGRLASCGL